MANLTETSYYARRTINWGILGIIGYIILRISWAILVAILMFLFPPKAPPPNHAFGVLPSIKFPAQASPSATMTFQLETIEGTVPKASESATVYFMPKQTANLLALPRTQQFAEKLDFIPKEIQETKNLYRFNDADYPLRTLRYDIITNNFTLQYAYGLDQAIFSSGNTPILDTATEDAKDFLSDNGLLPSDFSEDDFTATYLTLVGDTLVKTPSVTQANATRVNTKRTNIGGVPIYYPNPDESPISIVFSGSPTSKKKVLSISYTYWPIEYQTIATYKIKDSQVAWQELQSGGGYIAHYPSQGTTVTVRSVHLGYYDSIAPQTYLQPIFVFEGDDGFLGYVPAIAAPWTE
jgi:hypothetical protein